MPSGLDECLEPARALGAQPVGHVDEHTWTALHRCASLRLKQVATLCRPPKYSPHNGALGSFGGNAMENTAAAAVAPIS
jgi:hypothetical protein